MIRRVSAVIAILALARVSLSGAAACGLESQLSVAHEAHAHVVAVDSQSDMRCDSGNGATCTAQQQNHCAGLSSCAVALQLTHLATWSAQPHEQLKSVWPADHPLDPSRAPEPPPPRA